MSTTHLTKKTLMLDDAEVSIEPAVTPPPQTATGLPKKPKLGASRSRKKEIPEGLWTKCGHCGAALFKHILNTAEQHGYRALYLNAQTHAAGFYAKYGFVAAGPEFIEAAIPHIAMERLNRAPGDTAEAS